MNTMTAELAGQLREISLPTLGRRLRNAREAIGMTQADLARGIVSHAYISRIEAGHRRPHADVLEHLAARLGIALGPLLSDDEDSICGLNSRYGQCHRRHHQDDDHATCVGGGSDPFDDPEVWFCWGADDVARGWHTAVLLDSNVAHGMRIDRSPNLEETHHG